MDTRGDHFETIESSSKGGARVPSAPIDCASGVMHHMTQSDQSARIFLDRQYYILSYQIGKVLGVREDFSISLLS